jgi:hypothetical protein
MSSRLMFQSAPYFWSKNGSISFQYVSLNETSISVIRPPWNETKTLTGVLLFPTATPKGTRHEVSSQYGPIFQSWSSAAGIVEYFCARAIVSSKEGRAGFVLYLVTRRHYLGRGHLVPDRNALEVARRFSMRRTCEKELTDEQGSDVFHSPILRPAIVDSVGIPHCGLIRSSG